jgi:hypothetical protein
MKKRSLWLYGRGLSTYCPSKAKRSCHACESDIFSDASFTLTYVAFQASCIYIYEQVGEFRTLHKRLIVIPVTVVVVTVDRMTIATIHVIIHRDFIAFSESSWLLVEIIICSYFCLFMQTGNYCEIAVLMHVSCRIAPRERPVYRSRYRYLVLHARAHAQAQQKTLHPVIITDFCVHSGLPFSNKEYRWQSVRD